MKPTVKLKAELNTCSPYHRKLCPISIHFLVARCFCRENYMKNTPKRLNRPSKWKTWAISHPNYCHHPVGFLLGNHRTETSCDYQNAGLPSAIARLFTKNQLRFEKIFSFKTLWKVAFYRKLPFPRAFRVYSAIPHITQSFLTQNCLLRREPIDFESLLIVFTALRTFSDYSERRTTELSGKYLRSNICSAIFGDFSLILQYQVSVAVVLSINVPAVIDAT